MKAAVLCIIGLVGSWGHVKADPLLEGRVRLDSGAPVAGAQVLLFDLADLRAAPLAATTDRSGQFTLPLATLGGALPEQFQLGANYPNPFNPSTMIPYQLPVSMHVRLEVFNILGQRIATLVDGERPAGFHTASWDATDAAGEAVAAGVYLYRLSGEGVQATRSMLLIDGQAGIASGRGGSSGPDGEAGAGDDGEAAPVYGLAVSGPGLVPYVDPAFRIEAGMAPLDLVVEAPTGAPLGKVASSGGILGDVDNTGDVDFFDALLVALYSHDSSTVMPNNGDISLGDVDADGQVDLSDAWAIAAWLNDPSNPALPAGIGEPVASAASLSPDPSTVTFADDGAWHRFTVAAGEPVSVVANPGTDTPRLEITTRSGRGNYCPGEADDDQSRQDGQTIYLSGCSSGQATVELRRESDGTVLRTYTFEVTRSPADLVVESVSVSASTLTTGQSFTLSATVRNQGTAGAEATTLRYYRSSNRTISTQDTRVGTDAVGALAAAGTSAESIRLTAPSSAGTYYYGACVVSVAGESAGNNCSTGIRVTVEARSPDLIVESVSVSKSSLTTGESFVLNATVRNQGTDPSAATTLRYYRSTNATISTQDTQVGTDAVDRLAASGTSAESVDLTAPSSEGTYYYGACVESVAAEADTRNNCSSGLSVIVEEQDEDLDSAEPGIYNDNIFVLPTSEDLAVDWASFAVEDYTRRFYDHFEDEFDFLLVVNNLIYGVDIDHAYAGAFFSVSNKVQGIGVELFSNAQSWGSSGKLQGVAYFPYVGFPNDTPEYRWSPIGRGPGIHELLHRWANFVVPTLGSHWGFSSANGLLGGFDISSLLDHGSNRYSAGLFWPNGTAGRPFSPIELYLAGFIPPEEVPDLWVAEDGKWVLDSEGEFVRASDGDPIFTASRITTYTIEDIIAEHGPRVPDSSQSQRDFRAAVILMTDEKHPANRQVLERLSEEVSWTSHPAFTSEGDTYEHPSRKTNFYESTGGRATITMDDLSHLQRDASAKRLAPSSFGTPPPPIVDLRE